MDNFLEHLNIKDEVRDFNWDEKFFKIFSTAKVKLLGNEPQQGPDEFPYMLCETVLDNETSNENITEVQKLIHWLSTKGIGLVINPRRQPNPDYVFTYGMIWSFRQTGYFVKANRLEIKETQQKKELILASPSEDYLPKYVRQTIKDFFRDQMVLMPKILLVTTDTKNYDLCFSAESIGNPPLVEHNGICEAISWFLPTDYNIVIMSEKEFPQFELL